MSRTWFDARTPRRGPRPAPRAATQAAGRDARSVVAGLYGRRGVRHDEGMRSRTVAATAVVVVLVALTGCTRQQTAFDGVARAACETKVGPAIVAWWRDEYGMTPWKVVDTRSTGVEQGAGGRGGAASASVVGESAVQRDERGPVTQPVAWSCSVQTSADDPSSVSATIQEITLR
ncbi:hypothetical protein NS359_14570 [Curtobacterium oceanosedimentum]|uniref:Uncharacterized protein n=2 Tax=Curtobacterium oceanosedimentum TaxID=465820 RepID=A0A147DN19_9MICO|nr:hypothetical protein NS359_14570 [Curtobacterium oceanosedimentum]